MTTIVTQLLSNCYIFFGGGGDSNEGRLRFLSFLFSWESMMGMNSGHLPTTLGLGHKENPPADLLHT